MMLKSRILMAALLAASVTSVRAATYAVAIDPGVEEHAVTKMAMGAGLVYSWYPDSMFVGGEAAHIIRDIGVPLGVAVINKKL